MNIQVTWTSAVKTVQAVARRTQVDRAVLYSILQSLVVFGTGPLTALLIAVRFSPELQGYYYTFGSFATLQVFAEFGIGQAIIQFASHEWARLSFAADGEVAGDPDARSRLISLARIALYWYSIMAAVGIAILLVGGYAFFMRAGDHGVNWLGPWIAFSTALAVNLALMPMFYLLQGCNQVAEFWRYRLILQVLNGGTTIIALLGGAQLWSLPIASFVCIGWSLLFLWRRYPQMFRLVMSIPSGARIRWRTEVWPMQWRVAVSWLSNYFTSQMFAPILFQFATPAVAGRMGLTISLSNALLSLASSWITTKAPHFGILIAQGKFKALDSQFLRAFFMSMGVAAAGALCTWAGIALLNVLHVPLAERILAPLPAALLLLSSLIAVAILALATYLRAHRKEPLVYVMLITTVLTAITSLLTAAPLGVEGVLLSYLMLLVGFELPLCIAIFRRSRSKWHAESWLPSASIPF
jgi:O-antigen/teichoic acid export membrane protein